MDQFQPMRFGRRLWIYPWNIEPPTDDPDAVIVRLDPGLAFGTGTHPTTALCLEWLDAIDLAGKTVVDYGCGSGVLAIAALKLGAARVIGVDNDPQALAASRDNARAQRSRRRRSQFTPENSPQRPPTCSSRTSSPARWTSSRRGSRLCEGRRRASRCPASCAGRNRSCSSAITDAGSKTSSVGDARGLGPHQRPATLSTPSPAQVDARSAHPRGTSLNPLRWVRSPARALSSRNRATPAILQRTARPLLAGRVAQGRCAAGRRHQPLLFSDPHHHAVDLVAFRAVSSAMRSGATLRRERKPTADRGGHQRRGARDAAGRTTRAGIRGSAVRSGLGDSEIDAADRGYVGRCALATSTTCATSPTLRAT